MEPERTHTPSAHERLEQLGARALSDAELVMRLILALLDAGARRELA
jgi:DNA repair protein RadC